MELPTIDYLLFDGVGLALHEGKPNTLEEFYRAIKCNTIQGITGSILGQRYGLDIFIDDNGKIYGQDTITAIFVRDNKVIDYILGNILICRHDEEGDSTSVTAEDMLDVSQYLIPSERLKVSDDCPWKVANTLIYLPC